MTVIAVIDYDMGNLHSVCKGLEIAGALPVVTYDHQQILRADAVVLPGVGAFDPAMQKIRDRNLEQPINDAIASGKPFLGICLGMQLLFDRSEEGHEAGLGAIEGTVKRFQPESGITIPHMGWNQLEFSQPDCPLWRDLGDRNPDLNLELKLKAQPWVYFVHSFYVAPVDQSVVAATVTHGSQTVTASISRANLMAVQFHPEKSSTDGIKILTNFVNHVSSSKSMSKSSAKSLPNQLLKV